MARLSFRCDDELVRAVDRMRGRVGDGRTRREVVPRETWLRDLVMDAVAGRYAAAIRAGMERDDDNEPESVEEALTGRRPYRQSVPGPNVENIRSSAQVKGDVQPRPRGKR